MYHGTYVHVYHWQVVNTFTPYLLMTPYQRYAIPIMVCLEYHSRVWDIAIIMLYHFWYHGTCTRVQIKYLTMSQKQLEIQALRYSSTYTMSHGTIARLVPWYSSTYSSSYSIGRYTSVPRCDESTVWDQVPGMSPSRFSTFACVRTTTRPAHGPSGGCGAVPR